MIISFFDMSSWPMPWMSMLSMEWYWYVLNGYPILTKSLTTAMIQLCGDLLAQYYEYRMTPILDTDPDQRRPQQPEQTNHKTATKMMASAGSTINCDRGSGRIRQRNRGQTNDAKNSNPIQLQQQEDDRNGYLHSNGYRCRHRPAFFQGYSVRRGASLFVDGLVLSGPLLHFCFEYMEHYLPTMSSTSTSGGDVGEVGSREDGGNVVATCIHVLINDYIIDSIYITLSYIFTSFCEGHYKIDTAMLLDWNVNLMHSKSVIKDLFDKMRHDILPTIKASWFTSLGLIPIEFICFRYLKVEFRVLAMNFLDLFWGAIISFVSHQTKKSNRTKSKSTNKPKTS